MLIALLLAAQAPKVFDKFGWTDGIIDPGHRRCSQAWTKENAGRSELWLLGYFSGRNRSSGAKVGSESDGKWLIDAVKVSCEPYPDKHIIEIADQIFAKHTFDH